MCLTGQLQDDTIERLLRELTPLALGAVVRRFHDFAAAEDAVQEASLDAALKWPRQVCPTIHARGSRRSPFDG